MEIIKLKLKEFPGHIKGYSLFDSPTTDEFIWPIIVEELQRKPDKRFVDQYCTQEFTEDKNLEPYIPNCDGSLSIPRGTIIYYLHIVVEDRQ